MVVVERRFYLSALRASQLPLTYLAVCHINKVRDVPLTTKNAITRVQCARLRVAQREQEPSLPAAAAGAQAKEKARMRGELQCEGQLY